MCVCVCVICCVHVYERERVRCVVVICCVHVYERERAATAMCVMRGFAATAISELGGAAKCDGLVQFQEGVDYLNEGPIELLS